MTEGTGTLCGAATGSSSRTRSARSRAAITFRSDMAATIFRTALRAAPSNGADVDLWQRHRKGDSLGRTEVQRRERQRLVQGVTAGPPGIGVDRHSGLLQGPDITLDGPRAHLVQRCQFPGAAAAQRAGPKLLHERVQPVGPVHIPTVRPATDKLSWIRPFMTPLARWADDELRSTNAQIEFLLRHALADAGRLPGHAGRRRPGRRPRAGSPAEATRPARGNDRSG
jgi:hypothetical protein